MHQVTIRTALFFFEPSARVLISGDALWESRLAIIFPELLGEPGFDACSSTLDEIERLKPRPVVPGHGRPFLQVDDALRASRERLAIFARSPSRHVHHALRALAMFHMLDVRRLSRDALVSWLRRLP